jgi:hypothetical protein
VLASPAGWPGIKALILHFVRYRKADRRSAFDRTGGRRMETAKDVVEMPNL